MLTQPLSIVLVVAAFIGILACCTLLFKKGWILGWLRGMLGVALLSSALACGLVVIDLHAYKQLLIDKKIAKIKLKAKGPQTFQASFFVEGELEREFLLRGDQWQIDARIIRWKGPLKKFSKPGYQLDRIAGRYHSIDQERDADRTVYALRDEDSWFDLWSFAHENKQSLSWVDAVYGNATFVPMLDGAEYELVLTASGIAALPLNKIASEAVDMWRQ